MNSVTDQLFMTLAPDRTTLTDHNSLRKAITEKRKKHNLEFLRFCFEFGCVENGTTSNDGSPIDHS